MNTGKQIMRATFSAQFLKGLLESEYDIPSNCDLALYSIGHSDLYLLKARDGKKAMLKVYLPGQASPETIENEANLINQLRQNGINAAKPFAQKNGTYALKLNVASEPRFALLSEFLEPHSKTFDIATDARRYGEALGKLHSKSMSKSLSHPKKIDISSFLKEDAITVIEDIFGHRLLDAAFLKSVALSLHEHLKEFENQFHSKGVVHGDIHINNFLSLKDLDSGLAFIDFEHCFEGSLVYDLACLKHSLWSNSKDVMQGAWPQVIQGYLSKTSYRGCDAVMVDLLVIKRQLWKLVFNYNIRDYTGCYWLDEHSLNKEIAFIKEIVAHIKQNNNSLLSNVAVR